MTDPTLIDAIARRVVELLEERGHIATAAAGLVDAATVAAALGVRRQWVYDHKRQLGGRPIGDGDKPRWRFDLAQALAAHAQLIPAETPRQTTPRHRRVAQATDLLPIKALNPRRTRSAR